MFTEIFVDENNTIYKNTECTYIILLFVLLLYCCILMKINYIQVKQWMKHDYYKLEFVHYIFKSTWKQCLQIYL